MWYVKQEGCCALYLMVQCLWERQSELTLPTVLKPVLLHQIIMSRLPVGHTREDIDQRFSIMSRVRTYMLAHRDVMGD